MVVGLRDIHMVTVYPKPCCNVSYRRLHVVVRPPTRHTTLDASKRPHSRNYNHQQEVWECHNQMLLKVVGLLVAYTCLRLRS